MYKFKIIKKNYGYVILNTDLDTHAHLPTYRGCKILIKLIKKNIDIKDKYLRKARDRLLGESLYKKKQRYINKQKRK